MSGFLNLYNIECASLDCPLYVSVPIIGPLFIAADYFPLIITIAMFSVTLYHYELYFFLISLILTFDWGLNVALQYIIRQPARFSGCGSKYEMPSFSTQHAMLFLTLIITFFALFRYRMAPSKIFLAMFLTVFVILARVYIGINTAQQLVIGAFVGVLEGVAFQCIIYFCIYPYFNQIVTWKVAVLIGLENNICKTEMIKSEIDDFIETVYKIQKEHLSKQDFKRILQKIIKKKNF